MRVCQLREEEGMDVVNREVAHEREVQSSLQMARTLSQSCEDLVIDDDPRKRESRIRTLDYSDPLHLNIGFAAASLSSATSPCPGGSASPTRPGRQCFSPSLQQCVRNSPFTPSPSKRPQPFMARRSLSPITPRSSPLRTVKRKCESGGEEFATPSKRLSVGSGGEGGGLLMTQPHRSEGGGLRLGSAAPASAGSSPGSQHPHLFRPVSPAAVNAAAVGTVTDAPVAAAPIRPISVDEMMTEDNNLALPTQQVPMDHQVQSNEQNQTPHHLALLRSNCPGSSDVNVVQASESESHMSSKTAK
ncbi:hypothetical protein HAZT_HAZT005918 [Hyalella azteca]|uniref:Uncharacterized protein n=1 Tax=Hyalella azteca TaxID=294128 RepID=A0A6A0GUN2_HYAAZ|nr:hypothetical protein HAZT_HAZT005918 [Hyalella azteca]